MMEAGEVTVYREKGCSDCLNIELRQQDGVMRAATVIQGIHMAAGSRETQKIEREKNMHSL